MQITSYRAKGLLNTCQSVRVFCMPDMVPYNLPYIFFIPHMFPKEIYTHYFSKYKQLYLAGGGGGDSAKLHCMHDEIERLLLMAHLPIESINTESNNLTYLSWMKL